jgi:hypothetical protein
MKRMGVMVLAACALVAGCGDDDSPTGPSANAPVVFTAQLSPTNEVPPVGGSESTTRGAVQITFNLTRDSAGAVSAATSTFYFQVTDLPQTNIIGAHIHPGGMGVNGPVVVSTGLTATIPLPLSGPATDFSVSGIPVDPALAQAIINNPGAYYFNLHTPTNPGGVARGQLMRTQ